MPPLVWQKGASFATGEEWIPLIKATQAKIDSPTDAERTRRRPRLRRGSAQISCPSEPAGTVSWGDSLTRGSWRPAGSLDWSLRTPAVDTLRLCVTAPLTMTRAAMPKARGLRISIPPSVPAALARP